MSEQPPPDALQAAEIRAELTRSIEALQVEIRSFSAARAAYARNLMPAQAKRVEREIRRRIGEIRELRALIAAIDERFPPDAAGTPPGPDPT